MNLLDRIAHDPAYYAIRMIVLGLILFFVVVVVYAQERDIAHFACNWGVCQVKQSEAQELINQFHSLQKELMDLKAKTGCT